MVEETDNHSLNKYSTDETNWEHSTDMQHIEERLVIRDTDANRSNYTPHSSATFVATDTGAVYDGDGSSWNAATRSFATAEADRTETGSTGTNGNYYDDGRLVDEEYATWGQQTNYYDRLHDRDKAVISFSFDDSVNEDYTTAFPEFRDRGLPWAVNVIPSVIGGSSRLDQAQLNEIVANGAEVVCHQNSTNVSLHDITGDEAQLREEIVQPKRDLESMGYNIQGFLPYGQDGIITEGGSNSSSYDEYYSYLIRSTYDWSIGQGGLGTERAVGFKRLHGDGHKNYLLDSADDTGIIDMIDHLIAIGGSMEFSGHSGGWGSSEVTALQNVLDHCVTERDNGNLVVATPTTMRLQSRDPDDINMAPNGGAEAYDSWSNVVSWGDYGNTPEINTDGGSSGSNYWVIGTSLGSNSWSGLRLNRPPWSSQFPAMMVECDAKGASGGESLSIRSAGNTLTDSDIDRSHSLTTSWQTVRSPFAFHRSEGYAHLQLWTTSSEVHIDNIKIYPI